MNKLPFGDAINLMRSKDKAKHMLFLSSLISSFDELPEIIPAFLLAFEHGAIKKGCLDGVIEFTTPAMPKGVWSAVGSQEAYYKAVSEDGLRYLEKLFKDALNN